MKIYRFTSIYVTLLLCSIVNSRVSAQDQRVIDSLYNELRQQKSEINKIDLLVEISSKYWFSDPDKAIKIANHSAVLSKKCKYKKGEAKSYNSLGVATAIKGNYNNSLDFFKKTLTVGIEDNDTKGNVYNNIANVYKNMGNYPEALKYHFAALKTLEKTDDHHGIATARGNIGNVYCYLEKYPEAIKYQLASLKTMKATGDKSGVARALGNIGNVYLQMEKYEEAKKYYLEALELNKEIGNKKSCATNYGNIGILYERQGNYAEALQNYHNALKYHEEIDDKGGIATNSIQIGSMYVLMKKFKEAQPYLNNGLALGQETGSLQEISDAHSQLQQVNSALGNHKKALDHYKSYIFYRDSIYNNENTEKVVAQQMNYEFEKKQDSIKAFQEKKDLIAQKEMQKQKLVRNGFMGGFTIVLLFAGVFFLQRNKIKKSKKRSDELLLNILPEEVAEELKAKGSADAKQFDMVTVMFTDFKGFTQISEKLSPAELVAEIHYCFKAFDNIITKYNIEKIKTIGDAYMCVGGLPIPNDTNAIDVVSAALEIQQFMEEHFKQRTQEGKEIFEIRIGIHTGPVVAGIVGIKKFAYDIWGDTVNTASRMESSGEAGKINISGSTYNLVKDQFKCTHRGKIEAKGKGEIDMYFVEEKLA